MGYIGASEVLVNFESWFLSQAMGQRMVVWRMSFLVGVCALWRCHNRFVFHGGSFDEDVCFELCRFDLT